jgi:hypothetical protein
MPNGEAQRIAELISTPLEELIASLGAGIGRSQSELDRHSLEIQRLIDEDPVLSRYGLEATWYQIPTTDLELKIAVTMQAQTRPAVPEAPSGRPTVETELRAGRILPKLPRLWIQPVNARFQNQFSYDTQAASTVKLSIVAVPPSGEAAAGRPTRTEAEVLEAARPHLMADAAGNLTPRVTVNFNPGAGAWYVLQTSEADDAVTLERLVKVDDETLAVLKHEGD